MMEEPPGKGVRSVRIVGGIALGLVGLIGAFAFGYSLAESRRDTEHWGNIDTNGVSTYTISADPNCRDVTKTDEKLFLTFDHGILTEFHQRVSDHEGVGFRVEGYGMEFSRTLDGVAERHWINLKEGTVTSMVTEVGTPAPTPPPKSHFVVVPAFP